MRAVVLWVWNRGVVSTFLAGLFAILPVAITVAIIGWVAGYIHEALTLLGQAVSPLESQFAILENETVAAAIGLIVVLVCVWLLGLLVKSSARYRVQRWVDGTINLIPIVKSVYSTVSRLVGMLKKDDKAELAAMSVVFCSFGQARGGGFLGLLASPEAFSFDGHEYHVVYIPTSPIPMSGGVLFVPTDAVQPIDMTAEQVMRIYFSMGILSPEVIPSQYRPVQP